jgi:hypothetical protein
VKPSRVAAASPVAVIMPPKDTQGIHKKKGKGKNKRE